MIDETLRELRQLKSKILGEDEPFRPGRLRVPKSLRAGAEAGELAYEDGKLKIVAPDGTVKTFSPD